VRLKHPLQSPELSEWRRQHLWAAPLFAMIRFGLWNEILEERLPEASSPYSRAIWYFARGMASVHQGDLSDAQADLDKLGEFVISEELRHAYIWHRVKASQILNVAYHVLAGDCSAANESIDDAVNHLEAAIAIESNLTYNEPPDWPIPVRDFLGAWD